MNPLHTGKQQAARVGDFVGDLFAQQEISAFNVSRREFGPEQERLLNILDLKISIAANPQFPSAYFDVDGPAGCGKSVLLLAVMNRALDRGLSVHLLTPTNRARQVLIEKFETELGKSMANVDDSCLKISTLHAALYGRPNEYGIFPYGNKDKIKGIKADIVLVDESSMVPTLVLRDLLSTISAHGAQIVFFGDKAQLPPIGESAASKKDRSNILRNDFSLSEIHRHAGNILAFATDIRLAKCASELSLDLARKHSIPILSLQESLDSFKRAQQADPDSSIFITYTNKDRIYLNQILRAKIFDSPTQDLVTGERLISLSNVAVPVNVRMEAIFTNGQSFFAKEIIQDLGADKLLYMPNPRDSSKAFAVDYHRYLMRDELGRTFRLALLPNWLEPSFDLRLVQRQASTLSAAAVQTSMFSDQLPASNISSKTQAHPLKDCVVATYGLATSCHKAQGGQWGNVFISGFRKSKDWLYTAATRARSELCFVLEE